MKTTQLLKSRMQQTELREREGEQASYPRRNKDGSKKTYQDIQHIPEGLTNTHRALP